jgi:hypothetical protein
MSAEDYGQEEVKGMNEERFEVVAEFEKRYLTNHDYQQQKGEKAERRHRREGG